MASRALKVALLALLLGVFAWRIRSCQVQVEEKRRAAGAQTARFDAQTASEPSPLPLDPYARRAAIADAMRLPPDRRFLGASAQIGQLIGSPAAAASARFGEGKWKITAASEDLGEVPELPDYPDLMQPLVALAGRHLQAISPADLDQAPAAALQWEPEARAALPAALSHWSKDRSAGALHAAARAAASLAFYSTDAMETGDDFAARAIALVALDKAAGKAPTDGEEAVLASALGYAQAAREIASRLRADDSLRFFLAGDDARLRESAILREAGPADRYLRLRRAIQRQDEDDANLFLDSYHGTERLDLAVLMLLLRERRMEHFAPIAFTLPVFLLAAAEGVPVQAAIQDRQADTVKLAAAAAAKTLGVDSQSLSQRLEEALRKLGPEIGVYLRAAWLSALRRQGEFLADAQGDKDATAQFVDRLAKDPAPVPQLVHQWFAARTLAREGHIAQALTAVEKLTGAGGGAVAAVVEEAVKRSDFSDPRQLRGVRGLVPRLDSRPAHRATLGDIAWSPLQDLRACARLLRSAFEADPEGRGSLREWFAQLSGDGAELARIGSDKFEMRSTRKKAWGNLWQFGDASATDAEKGLRAMLDEDPNDDDVALELGKRLRLSGRLEDARAVMLAWLRPNDVPGLRAARARSTLSRYSYLAGRYAEGLEVVQPALEVGNASAMIYAALNLAGAGRAAEARQMIETLLGRYRSPSSVAAAAEVEWQLGDLEGAARRLAQSAVKLNLNDYREDVAEGFVRFFGERPDQAAAAAAALAKAGVDSGNLVALAYGLGWQGHPEAAFRVLEETHAPGDREDVIRMTALRALRKARGDAAVPAWVQKVFPNVPDDRGRHLALLAFREGIPEVVWDAFPSPKGNDDYAETTWMLRAAQVALAGAAAPESHRQALREHYAAVQKPTPHAQIGRYLIGEVPEAEAAKLVTNLGAACEVPYYFGVRAQGEKRFGDAADWYRVAVECGMRNEAEYTFASAELYRFRSEKDALGRLR